MHITCTGHRFHPGSEYQVASLTDRIPGQVSTGVGALFECLELDLPAAPSVCCNRPSDVCGVAGLLPERDRRCSSGGHPGWGDGGGFPGRTAGAGLDVVGTPCGIGVVQGFHPEVFSWCGKHRGVGVDPAWSGYRFRSRGEHKIALFTEGGTGQVPGSVHVLFVRFETDAGSPVYLPGNNRSIVRVLPENHLRLRGRRHRRDWYHGCCLTRGTTHALGSEMTRPVPRNHPQGLHPEVCSRRSKHHAIRVDVSDTADLLRLGSEYQVASLTHRSTDQVFTGVGALFECLELNLPGVTVVCGNRSGDVSGVMRGKPERNLRVRSGRHLRWRNGGTFPGRTASAFRSKITRPIWSDHPQGRNSEVCPRRGKHDGV